MGVVAAAVVGVAAALPAISESPTLPTGVMMESGEAKDFVYLDETLEAQVLEEVEKVPLKPTPKMRKFNATSNLKAEEERDSMVRELAAAAEAAAVGVVNEEEEEEEVEV